jgi:hypothetical protein
VAAGRAVSLSLPGEMDPDAFYLEGAWRAVTRGLTLESATGQVALRFEAGSLFSVLAGQPGDGGVDADAVWVEAFLDGAPVGPGAFGQDLILLQGASGLRVGLARSYHLLQSVSPGPHELRLAFTAPGATLYSITLEGCSVPPLPRSEVC